VRADLMLHLAGIYASLLDLFGAAVDQGVPLHPMADQVAEGRCLGQPTKTINNVMSYAV
jgi:hypothetical protein